LHFGLKGLGLALEIGLKKAFELKGLRLALEMIRLRIAL